MRIFQGGFNGRRLSSDPDRLSRNPYYPRRRGATGWPATFAAVLGDNFNRADSSARVGRLSTAPGSGAWWLDLRGVSGIAGNRAAPVNAADSNTSFPGGASDSTYGLKVAVVDNYTRILWRVASDGNYWMTQVTPGGPYLVYKNVNGSFSQVGGNSVVNGANGDVVQIVTAGDNHILRVNGSQQFNFNDATHQTAVRYGFGATSGVASRFEDMTFDGGTVASRLPQIVAGIDSLTAGDGLSNPSTECYPAQLQALLGGSLVWDLTNLGIGGTALYTAVTQAYFKYDPLQDWRRPKNIALILGGTNDLHQGQPVAGVIADYWAMCDARRAQGFTVLAHTLPPHSGGGASATFEADRQTFSTEVRTNWASHADGYVDIAADPFLGPAGAELILAYYQNDGTHWNATGAARAAALAYAEMQARGFLAA